jgi:hypothetical protein
MASTVIVTRSDATTDITFTEISQSGSKQIFLNKAAGLQEPESLELESSLRPVGAKGSDRYFITFKKADIDDVTGAFSEASVRLTITIPRATGITSTKVKDLAKFMQCMLLSTNIADIFNGVLPNSGDYHVDSYVPT